MCCSTTVLVFILELLYLACALLKVTEYNQYELDMNLRQS